MKPIQPYADYYVSDQILQNCRLNSSSNVTSCRYVRKVSSTKNCDNLNTPILYNNADFTNIYQAVGTTTTSNNNVISTNCAIINTQNYNPGIENSLLSVASVYSALLVIGFVVFIGYSIIRKIPPLWQK